ncbi:hypothetical protein R1sor_019258 [Riccia sorocarpa]|uniref:Uncharacterized protein n=1 Tax=Riccia sorocarpa TaxID=122646 RepID=A0ABD3ID42_9MARC
MDPIRNTEPASGSQSAPVEPKKNKKKLKKIIPDVQAAILEGVDVPSLDETSLIPPNGVLGEVCLGIRVNVEELKKDFTSGHRLHGVRVDWTTVDLSQAINTVSYERRMATRRELFQMRVRMDGRLVEVMDPNELDISQKGNRCRVDVSVRHKNAKARVERRREKNVIVTNPYGHQGFSGFRARFKKAFDVYPEPKHNAFLCAHGMKRLFEFMRTGRDFPEVGGPSSAEVGADDTAGADDGADGAAAGSDAGADDDGAEFSQLEGSEDEFEEDDQCQAPQQERVEKLEDAEDDEEDEDSSRFEIREALRAPVEPAITEAQCIIRFVTGGESSAPRTIPQLAVLHAIPLDPPSDVLRAIPPVARTVTPRTVTPQPPTARAVVSDPSRARTMVPEPSTRQTRAHTQQVSARGTEERRAKKKKSKK